jgi:hypothetical protein
MRSFRDRDDLTPLQQEQLDAIWKWKWLGWRRSTPAFKGMLVILAVAALGLAGYVAMLPR